CPRCSGGGGRGRGGTDSSGDGSILTTLDAMLRELVASAVREQVAPLDAKLDRLTAMVEVQRAELLALEKIRGGTARAAHEFLRRHPELRRLGVRVGRRLLFRQAEVEHYFREEARP